MTELSHHGLPKNVSFLTYKKIQFQSVPLIFISHAKHIGSIIHLFIEAEAQIFLKKTDLCQKDNFNHY
jgi:hypothetical protein